MKHKGKNRVLAALLAAAMMFQMLPMMAFADEGAGSEGAPSDVTLKSTGKSYSDLQEAVKAAESVDTILLGEGKYSLYGIPSTGMTKGKDLTFVGRGTDKTVWAIGADVPDPNKTGEYNGDYSFDGAGTVTFENMTLRPGKATDPNTKLGFIRPGNTVVEYCEIVGWTAYWGDNSAKFKNTTFKPFVGKDAIWVYSSPVMTFDRCTFNASGKAINVYTDYSAGKHDITVNFENCTVNGAFAKQALNINDSNMGSYKYILNLSSSNQATAALDKTTCSRVFGFGGKSGNDTGRTEVYVDNEHVWGKKEGDQKGELKTHKYSAGEAERMVIKKCTGWTETGSHYKRDVITMCCNCGYTTKSVENGYKLAYDLNGGVAAEGEDYTDKIVAENETVKLAAAPAPAQEGVYFLGWDDGNGKQYNADASIMLTANTTLTAQWGDVPPVEPDTPAGGGGEIAGVIVAAGTAVISYYAGTGLLMRHYGLPYWPKNRSELALMLWEDADRPMPESALLYPDVGQEEEDMDLQHAARWAMENELLPDLNWDDSRTEEEMKFYPKYAVSRARALHAWRKAQQLKQDA